MDFTREPIIETVITPKEGCKIVVRSSKSSGQEEYFVDAVEVVSFGNSLFFRSMERPKAFLVPVSDYEILEVREARMVLKNVGIDRAIKIGGGRDAQMRAPREQAERPEKAEKQEKAAPAVAENAEAATTATAEGKQPEKKRDRRRQYRRRRGRDGAAVEEEDAEEENKENAAKVELAEPRTVVEGEAVPLNPIVTPSVLTSLLPPPPTLISETIARYKDNALFRDAFYSRSDEKPEEVHIHETVEAVEGAPEEVSPVDDQALIDGQPLEEIIPISQPAYGSFEVSEQEEEEIYQQRKRGRSKQVPVLHENEAFPGESSVGQEAFVEHNSHVNEQTSEPLSSEVHQEASHHHQEPSQHPVEEPSVDVPPSQEQ